MKESRRNFCKKSLAILGGAFLVSESKAAPPTVALDPKNATAVALGYHEDATKVDKAKWAKIAQPGPAQKCSNCLLYTQGGLKVAGKDGEWGVCTIFPQGLVAANGWCNSWALKPGA